MESIILTERAMVWLKNVLDLIDQSEEMEFKERQRAFTLASERFAAFEKKEKNQVKAYIRSELGDAESLTFYSYLAIYTEESVFWEEIIYIITTGTFDCYHGAMLGYQVYNSAKLNAMHYGELREMQRANAIRFQDCLKLKIPYTGLKDRNWRRICIVTEQLLSLRHAPTRWVLDFCYALQKFLNYEVTVVSCPSDLLLDDLYFERNFISESAKEKEGRKKWLYRDDTYIDVWQVSLSSRDTDEYIDLMHYIAEWNPLFVFQVGVINPVAELPAQFTSLVSMKLSSGCPVSDAGILVRLNRGMDEEEQFYEDSMRKDQLQLLYDKKMPVLVQENENAIKRCDLGLPEEEFLVAIVGNRLDREVDASFLAIMERVISQEPHVSIVWIGDGVPEILLGQARLEGHLYMVGHQEDLMAAYSCMDLYVNPKRQGGGVSAVMALMAGVPVVTLPGGDVAWNVGEDFTVADEEQMEKEILRYIRDGEFYKMKHELAYEHAKQNNEEELAQYAKGLMDGIIGLLEEQERRRFAGV